MLYAIAEAGAENLPGHIDWLIRHTAEPLAGARLGLYDGMIGVASVLSRLGHPGAAQRVAEICLAERWDRLGIDLHGGLSGMALALLHLGDATGEVRLREAALRAADMVAARAPGRASSGDGGPAGLLRGPSGPALLFIRMFERTDDPGYLDLAAAALGADLDRCVSNGNGALMVDEGWRSMPYLDGGSAGIGLVIDDFLAHRRDAGFERAAAGIQAAACSTYYALPGLFRGRAGMMLYLSRGRRADRVAVTPGSPRMSAAWPGTRSATAAAPRSPVRVSSGSRWISPRAPPAYSSASPGPSRLTVGNCRATAPRSARMTRGLRQRPLRRPWACSPGTARNIRHHKEVTPTWRSSTCRAWS